MILQAYSSAGVLLYTFKTMPGNLGNIIFSPNLIEAVVHNLESILAHIKLGHGSD